MTAGPHVCWINTQLLQYEVIGWEMVVGGNINRPIVSVIVPVYRDWGKLDALIRALESQSIGVDSFEAVIVNNDPGTPPESTVDFPDFVRLEECAQPGSYAARNKGIEVARAPIFAFTDADCRPDRLWLRRGLDKIRDYDNQPVIVAGQILVLPEREDAPTPVELYDSVMGLPQEEYVGRGYGATANLIVPRQIFSSVGMFDAARFSGGDAEFCRRAGAHGFRILYCHEAKVDHPARSTWREIRAKRRRVKGAQLTAGPIWRRAAYGLRTVLPPCRAWAKALRAEGLTVRQRLSVVGIQSALWATEIQECCRILAGGKPART